MGMFYSSLMPRPTPLPVFLADDAFGTADTPPMRSARHRFQSLANNSHTPLTNRHLLYYGGFDRVRVAYQRSGVRYAIDRDGIPAFRRMRSLQVARGMTQDSTQVRHTPIPYTMKTTPDAIDAVVHTDPFGKVPKDRIDTVTLDGLSDLQQEILQISERAANSGQWRELSTDEEFLKKLDHFRTSIGALWLKLWKQLDEDIDKAHQVSDNFWKCMWVALVRRQLRVQKYRSICGTPSCGFGGFVTYLANVPAQEQLVQRWQCSSWKQYVDKIWKTKNQLIEKESEYRGVVTAIAQIGVGVGGMLLGLIGLGLSLIISLVNLIR